MGYVPERLLHSRGTSRLLFMPLASALMAATCLALAFAHLPLLFPLAALSGFAFGEGMHASAGWVAQPGHAKQLAACRGKAELVNSS